MKRMRVTKNIVFWAGLAGASTGYVVENPLKFGFCQSTYTFGSRLGCLDKTLPMFGEILLIFCLSILLISLITYKMREEVFRSWLHFSCVWLPLSIFLTLKTPTSSGSSIGISWDPATTAGLFASLFVIISLVIIAWKWFRLRNKSARL